MPQRCNRIVHRGHQANGAAVESTTNATLTGTGNAANKITVDVVASWNILIRNNLGETVTYSYTCFWN